MIIWIKCLIFTYAFKDADTVILCPIYTAGEKIKLGFDYHDFAKKIIKNSKIRLFIVENKDQLAKYLKQNMYGKKIVVGMGAGSISNWIKELPNLIKWEFPNYKNYSKSLIQKLRTTLT